MARTQGSWNKREIEQRKEKKRKDKEQKKQERKASSRDGNSLDDMIAYVDENGNITDTPPDPSQKTIIKAEDIELGVPKREPEEQEDVNRTGVISYFSSSKGFGFIRDLANQQSIFVHINEIDDVVVEGDKVTFMVGAGKKGPMAIQVKKLVEDNK